MIATNFTDASNYIACVAAEYRGDPFEARTLTSRRCGADVPEGAMMIEIRFDENKLKEVERMLAAMAEKETR